MIYRDIYAWLIAVKKIAPSSIRDIRDHERKHGCNPYTAIEEMNLCSREELNIAVQAIHMISAFEQNILDYKRCNAIPVAIMSQHKFIALLDPNHNEDSVQNQTALILIADPRNKIPVSDTIKKSGFLGKIKVFWIRESDFDNWMKANSRSFAATSIGNLANNVESVGSMMADDAPIDSTTDDAADSAIIDLVNEIVHGAIELGASDIHIEPCANGCLVRYRLDGVLMLANQIDDISKARRIINRIKVMGRMDTSNSRIPQSGRINFSGRDIRVSTLPTITGEKVVLRILNSDGGQIRTLKELGVPTEHEDVLREMFTRPYGIILVSGPTGSGKSSTLAAILKELCTEDVCMVTIEDPVEYRIAGAVQVNVDTAKGLTFPSVLRETLRQDPNIIMVGEIRDKETAEISMQAANTGHLVFSTIHTNSAATAITRLNDIGVDGYLLADNIICIVSQTLVRKLCPHCKEAHVLTMDDLKKNFAPQRLLGKNVYEKGSGCHHCNRTGYLGRTIAFESLEITPEIVKAIHEKKTPLEIEEIASKQRFVRKIDFAYGLVENGVTSLKEVRRVLGGSHFEKIDT